jgi:hypothetical protein
MVMRLKKWDVNQNCPAGSKNENPVKRAVILQRYGIVFGYPRMEIMKMIHCVFRKFWRYLKL